MGRALVVVPTYNEADNITKLIPRILAAGDSFEVLVVDDNSPDMTAEAVKALMEANPRVHLLQREKKMGLGTAYVAGFRYALQKGFDFIFEMDADFSHDPAELPIFFQKAQQCDLVIGSRYVAGVNVVNWPIRRLLLSYMANVYTRWITGMPVRDATGGFKCYRRTVLEEIDLDAIHSNGYAFQIEMTWWAVQRGFRVGEVPIIFYGRDHGVTKFSKAILWEAVWAVWKLRLGLVRNRRL